MVGRQILLMVALLSAGEVVAQVPPSGAELLCFGAKWCKPCQEMQPTLERLIREGFPLRRIDVDRDGKLAARFRVQSVPAFVLVDQTGQVIDSMNRATDYDTLRRMLVHYKIMPSATTVRGQSPSTRDPGGIRVADASEFPRPNNANTAAPAIAPALGTAFTPGATFATATAATPQATANNETFENARDKAMASAVRLRVEDKDGHSFGTGTVVDVHRNEALIVTCGHIFRTSEGKGRILIDRFDMKMSEPAIGTLINYDIDRDVALVSMKLTRPMQIAKLAPLQYKANKDEPVFSIGCDHGEPPTILNGQINQIDKYLGPPNLTVSGRPVSGRSGGGLFNLNGELIGVCSAADPEVEEGIYGALPRIYYELDRNGLSFVYKPKDSQNESIASNPPTSLAPRTDLAMAPNYGKVAPATSPAGEANFFQAPSNPVAAVAPTDQSQDQRELVCVLRDDDGDSQAYVIKNPSPTLLESLRREADNQVK